MKTDIGRSWHCRTALILLVSSGSRIAAAQGDPQLQPQLERLRQAAQTDPAISQDLRDAITGVADALALTGRTAVAQPSVLEQVFEKLRPLGDFRLRHETDFHLDDMEDRNRERIRLRFGAEYDVNEQIVVGARLVTGSSSDENSPHQNLGATFDKLSISLDRAYATWRPESLDGAWITAGKFQHAFVLNPVYSEVVWDADVQPSGLAAGWRLTDVPAVGEFELVAGEYIILDNATSGTIESAWAWVAQLTTRQNLGSKTWLSESIGIYRYQDLEPDNTNLGRLLSENAGNATVDRNGDGIADDFLSSFTIWNPIVAVTNTGFSQPITVAAEWIHNTRARIAADQGYAIGCSVGRNRAPRDWLVYYQWQVMEQDAVLSNFTNDDLLFATNYRAHLAGVKYQVLDRTELHLWASVQIRDDRGTTPTTDSERLQWRARLDLNIRF